MKLLKITTSGRIYALVSILLLTLILQSCATKYAFNNSYVVPAAEGSVKVKRDKNNNYKVLLNVKRLADPSRLSPSKAVYVVWMETEQDGTKNIGQLKTASSLLSHELKSSLKTTSPTKPVCFFITAEDNSGIQYPDGQEILRTNSSR